MIGAGLRFGLRAEIVMPYNNCYTLYTLTDKMGRASGPYVDNLHMQHDAASIRTTGSGVHSTAGVTALPAQLACNACLLPTSPPDSKACLTL